ncbi:MAG: FkbM family methyltransferase [Acidimicrobiia bacterium]|nr:FkbM family methyltransferase [Acidimicrobiia bacterium]
MVRGDVSWEGLSFPFVAPFTIFERAASQGVENLICRLIVSEVAPGDTTIDVGSNYGFITRVMARTVGSTGRVVAVEADPDIAATLTTSLRSSGFSQVEVLPRAAGVAPLLSIDSLLSTIDKVSFLKIDVDGPELDVLHGARGLLERDHPIVVVELNETAGPIHEFLREVGYSTFTGLDNQTVDGPPWPPNLVAAVRAVDVPQKRLENGNPR